MSEAGKSDRLQASHDTRRAFQALAYNAAVSITVCFCFLTLAAMAWPPPAPNTQAIDWGATVVARAKDVWPVITAALGVLSVWVGMTLARGAYDARLDGGAG